MTKRTDLTINDLSSRAKVRQNISKQAFAVTEGIVEMWKANGLSIKEACERSAVAKDSDLSPQTVRRLLDFHKPGQLTSYLKLADAVGACLTLHFIPPCDAKYSVLPNARLRYGEIHSLAGWLASVFAKRREQAQRVRRTKLATQRIEKEKVHVATLETLALAAAQLGFVLMLDIEHVHQSDGKH